MSEKFVYSFAPGSCEGDPARKDLLGGKGASLAAMCGANLPVPPGFTISAQCCQPFLEAGGSWPIGLEEQVRAALAGLEETTGRTFGDIRRPLLVSVRSGAAVSMPGMMDTILNCGLDVRQAGRAEDAEGFWKVYTQFVFMFARTAGGIDPAELEQLRRQAGPADGTAPHPVSASQDLYRRRTGRHFPLDPWDVLVECINTVFRSWNSERAIAFRQRQQVRGLLGTAVTVQAMFPSQVSGIVFTTNPSDLAAQEMVIESSFGLGEAVVSGDVHPDCFVLDRANGRIKSSRIGHKTHVVFAFGDRRPIQPDQPSLTAQQVDELAQMALRVEGFFGHPLDIEWGWADGRFALLQARPVKGLEEARAYEQLLTDTREQAASLLQAGRGPWVLHNLAETLAHPTPLTWSVLRRFMSPEGGFGAMYRQAGFQPSPRLGSEGFLTLLAGRIYMDLSRAGEMFFENYPYRYDLDLLRLSPEASQAPPTLPAGSIRDRWRAGRKAAAVNVRLRDLAGDFDRQLAEELIPQFVATCRAWKGDDLTALSAEGWVQRWQAIETAVMDGFAPASLLPSLIAAMALQDLRAFLAEQFYELNEDFDELAGAISAPRCRDMTLRSNMDLFALSQGRMELGEWLDRYAHRAAGEFDLAAPRWREQPEQVRALAARLRHGADPADLHQAHLDRTQAQVESLTARLAETDRTRFHDLLTLARRYLVFREDGKHYLMLGYDLLRDLALEAGRRLGIGEDVFFLTVEELKAAVSAGTAPVDVIAARRLQRKAQARLSLPRLIDARALDRLGEGEIIASADSYQALPISPGLASGPAWICRSPTQADQPPRGYVLVCPSTDPAWAPLFVNAAALVLESGGSLSHGAIVAREMGIPAVVLPGATQLLAQGEQVSVDGRHGRAWRAGGAATAGHQAADPSDVRIQPALQIPPPGPRERRMGRIRNYAFLLWGLYLVALGLLPDRLVYRPSMALLDALLWPLVTHLGKPGAVAAIAGGMALLTMLLQRVLCDNRRLREAKRRANLLARQAAGLDVKAPRRRALQAAGASLQGRLLAGAMVPIGLLLGPMIITFLWLPARVDPASWNAPPGSSVSVVVKSATAAGQVRLAVQSPLALDETTPADWAISDIRPGLQRLRARQGGPAATRPASAPASAPAEVSLPALDVQYSPQDRQSLEAYLADGAVQPNTWLVRCPPGLSGRFTVEALAADGHTRLTGQIVLGDQHAPADTVVEASAPSPLRSLELVYPTAGQKKVFLAPLGWAGLAHWELGWLGVYLLVYLPAMFVVRWLLGVA